MDIINFIKDNYFSARDSIDQNFLNNFGMKSETLLLMLGLTIIIVFVINKTKNYLLEKLARKTEKTINLFDDKLVAKMQEISVWFYSIVTIFFLSNSFEVHNTAAKVINILTIITVFTTITRFLDLTISVLLTRNRQGKAVVDLTVKSLLVIASKSAFWIIGFLLVLSALEYDISNLATGLGVTGIVLGFALQNVLSDVFSSISIYIDQPFRVGDFIQVGDDSGNIVKIGLKSTRLKTLKGEELTISNKELTETRIHNYEKLRKRRVEVSLGLVYETKTEVLEEIPRIIEEIIEKIEKVEFSRCHFHNFGHYSLDLELIYFIKTGDYAIHMDKKQEINLAIMKAFEKRGIKFAFPSQTVYLSK